MQLAMVDKTGSHVIYLDEYGRSRHALIQEDWNKNSASGPVNLIVVSNDSNKEDQYGRQLEHRTSIAHISQGYEKLRANCWLTEEEFLKLPSLYGDKAPDLVQVHEAGDKGNNTP